MDKGLELLKAYLEAETAEAPETKVTENFVKKDMSVNVREIKNGYIVSRSWYEGESDDCCHSYKNEEEYYATNPLA
jgi:3-methyladenine DNA glycosylase Mpg